MKNVIREQLESFDGRRIDSLEQILSKHSCTNSFIEDLVLLAADRDQNTQTGATWLLKRLLENHTQLKKEHLIALFGSLSELRHWLSKLHICQMLPYLAIPKESKGSLIWFLERNVGDENKFLRAWSYNGFYELARQYLEYFDYAIEQIERGDTDKAASVRARTRNIRKALNKLPKKN